MKKSFHIIGGGRVGETLARILHRQGWQPLAVVCRSSHALWADRVGAHQVPAIGDLPPADALLLSTPDDVLADAAAQTAALPWLSAATFAWHCSGAKSVAALAPLAQRGVQTGCLHPVFAFADADTAVQTLAGHFCALEAGSPAALPQLHQLAEHLALRAFEVPSELKARYHAALSAASNFPVALAAAAQQWLQPLNLPDGLARELVAGLMLQSVGNLALLPPLQALTGPIVRGDAGTVAAHLAALSATEAAAYRAWAATTLQLAAARLDDAAVQGVQQVLSADG